MYKYTCHLFAAPAAPAVPPAPVFAPSPRQPESAPLFTIKLSNQPCNSGQTAHFECKVKAFPPPEILWTRRGHPLVDKARFVFGCAGGLSLHVVKACTWGLVAQVLLSFMLFLVTSRRYQSTYDQYNGVTTLTILNLCPEDEGEYTCTAINSQGETSTSAMLLGPGTSTSLIVVPGTISLASMNLVLCTYAVYL